MLAKAIACQGFGYRSYDPLDLVDGQEQSGVLVIDTPPHWDVSTEVAVATADLLIIPVKSIPDFLQKDLGVRMVQIMSARGGRKSLVVQTEAAPSAEKVIQGLSSLPGVIVHPDVICYDDAVSCSASFQRLLLAVLAQIQPVPAATEKAFTKQE